jgi:hypothetical protein
VLLAVIGGVVVVALFASSVIGALVGFLGAIVRLLLVLVVAGVVLVWVRRWIARFRDRG